MGKFGINERHSSLELNWHLPVVDAEAMELKRFLVRELDQQDISIHGLTFTIKTSREMFLFTSIVIAKSNVTVTSGGTGYYDLLYAKDFNPNTVTYLTYATHVRRELIPALLIELSKLYFRQLNPEKEIVKDGVRDETPVPGHIDIMHQCSNCLTIYDRKYGDPGAQIPAGTPFSALPETYRCHVCDSEKKYFVALKE